MKKQLLIPCVAAAMMMSCGGGQSNQSTETDSTATVQTSTPALSDQEFFESEEKLPQQVDLTQDISSLSYQRLRFLKAYVYATKGFWLKEMDLNSFFIHRTNWYEDLAWDRWEDDVPVDPNYWELWEKKYQAAMDLEQLSPDEKTFVDKINARMAELAKSNYQNINGLSLANPVQACNIWQFPIMYNQDTRLWKMLQNQNVAFQTTNYEQIFNVYEDNSYKNIPNFVTTDLFLQAFHMYFAYCLKYVENNNFTNTLSEFLTAALSSGNYGATNDDEEPYLDFAKAYFQIALKLLKPDTQMNYPTSLASECQEEIQNCTAASDKISPLLHTQVDFPYSLFKPRGHYTRNELAQRYFRAMQWLQLASFDSDKPDQVKNAIAIAYVYNQISAGKKNEFLNMFQSLNYLMGEPDNVAIIQIADQLNKIDKEATLSDFIDTYYDEIDKYIQELFKTCNRIQPKVQVTTADKINFMPARYTFDDEILSQMYDEKTNADRSYPYGVDVFDALGVKAAAAIEDSSFSDNRNWADYGKFRGDMSKKFSSFQDWNISSYNKWMNVLTQMQKVDKNYPDFMKTSSWEIKNLNAALASWAELKHDAILYAEQPMGAECGDGGLPSPIPAGFVEPNLNFWNTLLEAIDNVCNNFGTLTQSSDNTIDERTRNFKDLVTHCRDISQKEINHKKLFDEDQFFIYGIGSSLEYFTLSVLDPDTEYLDSWSNVKGADRSIAVVADVYTRNILGCNKCGILYEATGCPNRIYVLVEIDGNIYLTVGGTFSYYEFVRPLGDRLTDEQWQEMLNKNQAPAQPTWFAPLLIDEKIEASETHAYSSGC